MRNEASPIDEDSNNCVVNHGPSNLAKSSDLSRIENPTAKIVPTSRRCTNGRSWISIVLKRRGCPLCPQRAIHCAASVVLLGRAVAEGGTTGGSVMKVADKRGSPRVPTKYRMADRVQAGRVAQSRMLQSAPVQLLQLSHSPPLA